MRCFNVDLYKSEDLYTCSHKIKVLRVCPCVNVFTRHYTGIRKIRNFVIREAGVIVYWVGWGWGLKIDKLVSVQTVSSNHYGVWDVIY